MSRKVLMLEQRLEVVKHLENGKSSREIAQIMGVGRTQIQTINKRKAEILEDYENNISSDRKRKRHKIGNEEIHELCWTWCSRMLCSAGRTLRNDDCRNKTNKQQYQTILNQFNDM